MKAATEAEEGVSAWLEEVAVSWSSRLGNLLLKELEGSPQSRDHQSICEAHAVGVQVELESPNYVSWLYRGRLPNTACCGTVDNAWHAV